MKTELTLQRMYLWLVSCFFFVACSTSDDSSGEMIMEDVYYISFEDDGESRRYEMVYEQGAILPQSIVMGVTASSNGSFMTEIYAFVYSEGNEEFFVLYVYHDEPLEENVIYSERVSITMGTGEEGRTTEDNGTDVTSVAFTEITDTYLAGTFVGIVWDDQNRSSSISNGRFYVPKSNGEYGPSNVQYP